MANPVFSIDRSRVGTRFRSQHFGNPGPSCARSLGALAQPVEDIAHALADVGEVARDQGQRLAAIGRGAGRLHQRRARQHRRHQAAAGEVGERGVEGAPALGQVLVRSRHHLLDPVSPVPGGAGGRAVGGGGDRGAQDARHPRSLGDGRDAGHALVGGRDQRARAGLQIVGPARHPGRDPGEGR
jgi:hypothetical protein